MTAAEATKLIRSYNLRFAQPMPRALTSIAQLEAIANKNLANQRREAAEYQRPSYAPGPTREETSRAAYVQALEADRKAYRAARLLLTNNRSW